MVAAATPLRAGMPPKSKAFSIWSRSRAQHETDSNYANIFSFWDRLFSTFTPARQGREVTYGLDGLDDPSNQTVAGLLTLPFRGEAIRSDTDDRRRA